MFSYNILYIEHESVRTVYQDLFTELAENVVCIKQPEEIQSKLVGQHFNLIVTDAYFPIEEEDHVYERGKYRLDEILNLIQEHHNKPCKIAVLSNFGSELLEKEEFNNVSYLWNKSNPLMKDTIKWQINSLKRELTANTPNYSLIDAIIKLTNEPHGRVIPWRDNIQEMLDAYLHTDQVSKKVDLIQIEFNKIFSQYELSEPFTNLLKILVRAELFTIAAKPHAFKHLLHSIHVFWLGYYILNSPALKTSQIYESLFPQLDSVSEEKQSALVSFAWLLTALFHDVGYIAEVQTDIVKECNTILNEAFSIADAISLNSSKEDVIKPLLDNYYVLRSNLKRPFDRLVDDQYNLLTNGSDFDHPIFSALVLLSFFKSYVSRDSTPDRFERMEYPVVEASTAISLHNVIKLYGEAQQIRFSFLEFPLISLLLICDQIQIWDRIPTDIDGVNMDDLGEILKQIDYVDVTKFSFNNNELKMSINYTTHDDMPPTHYQFKKIQNTLANFLDNTSIKTLKQIDFAGTELSITVKYKINKSTTVTEWSTKSNSNLAEL